MALPEKHLTLTEAYEFQQGLEDFELVACHALKNRKMG